MGFSQPALPSKRASRIVRPRVSTKINSHQSMSWPRRVSMDVNGFEIVHPIGSQFQFSPGGGFVVQPEFTRRAVDKAPSWEGLMVTPWLTFLPGGGFVITPKAQAQPQHKSQKLLRNDPHSPLSFLVDGGFVVSPQTNQGEIVATMLQFAAEFDDLMSRSQTQECSSACVMRVTRALHTSQVVTQMENAGAWNQWKPPPPMIRARGNMSPRARIHQPIKV